MCQRYLVDLGAVAGPLLAGFSVGLIALDALYGGAASYCWRCCSLG